MSVSTVSHSGRAPDCSGSPPWAGWPPPPPGCSGVAVVITAVQLLLALTRSGALLTPVPSSQPGSLVCLSTPPALLRQVGSELTAPALAQGVHATWGTASLCTALRAPRAGPRLRHHAPARWPAHPRRALPGDAASPDRRPRWRLHPQGRPAGADPRLVAAGRRPRGDRSPGVRPREPPQRAGHRSRRLGAWPAAWSVSWPVFWFGLGLIIFARIMRVSAGMRADLEGTV